MHEARELMSPKPKKLRTTPMTGTSNTITSLPPAPVDERHGRMVRYSISMGIRMVCIIVIFFVPGWWRFVPAIAAIVLPYIAVVLANAGHDGTPGEVERPGGVELYQEPTAFPGYGQPTPEGAAPARASNRSSEAPPRRATYTADGYVAPRRAAPPAGGTAPPAGGYEAPRSGSDGEPRPDQR